MSISLTLPRWIYWHLVGVAEQENEELPTLFATATRAIIADFDAVEAIALKKVVTRLANEGFSDPTIGKMLEIPARRVRAVRVTFGIESKVRGRGRKIEAPVNIGELVT